MRFFLLLLLAVSNVVRASDGIRGGEIEHAAGKPGDERRATLRRDDKLHVIAGDRNLMSSSKGKGKGKGMPMMMGKGKGMSSSKGKGKGTGKSASKGKGKGMSSSKGKGKGSSSMSKGKGKGKGSSSMSKGKGKGKGKGSSSKGKGGTPSAPSTGKYKIQLMNMGNDTTYDHLFERAARRWEEVIIGDLPDLPAIDEEGFDWFFGEFDMPYAGEIDDLVIGFAMSGLEYFPEEPDSVALGYAGGRVSRTLDLERKTLPITTSSGIMRFNTEAIKFFEFTEDDFYAIILHEMGHVIGIGGVGWDINCATNCQIYDEEADEYYVYDDAYRCPLASFAFYDLGLKTFYEQGIPLSLATQGGLGSICGHWSEASFNTTNANELMTPFFDEDVVNPLSTVTIGALEDLGYEVDYHAADSFPKDAIVDGHRRRRHLQEESTSGTGVTTTHTFDLTGLIQHPKDNHQFIKVLG